MPGQKPSVWRWVWQRAKGISARPAMACAKTLTVDTCDRATQERPSSGLPEKHRAAHPDGLSHRRQYFLGNLIKFTGCAACKRQGLLPFRCAGSHGAIGHAPRPGPARMPGGGLNCCRSRRDPPIRPGGGGSGLLLDSPMATFLWVALSLRYAFFFGLVASRTGRHRMARRDALWLGFALAGWRLIGPVGIRWATVALSRDRSAPDRVLVASR